MGERAPSGWKDAYIEFDKLFYDPDVSYETLRNAYTKLENLPGIFSQEYVDGNSEYSKLSIGDRVLLHCDFRVRKRKAEKTQQMHELFEQAHEYYLEECKTKENFLLIRWIHTLADLSSQIRWEYTSLDEQKLPDWSDSEIHLNVIEKSQQNKDEIRVQFESWFPPSEDEQPGTWIDPMCWIWCIRLIGIEQELDTKGANVDSQRVTEIHGEWDKIIENGLFSEGIERATNLGLLLMYYYCQNTGHEQSKDKIKDVYHQLTKNLIRTKDIKNCEYDNAAASAIECLSLAIIADMEEVHGWYEKCTGDEDFQRFWGIIGTIHSEGLPAGEREGILDQILKKNTTINVKKPKYRIDDQPLYKKIVEDFWDDEKIVKIQRQYYDNLFGERSGGRELYDDNSEIWQKRGLTYVHEGRLYKVWFGEPSEIESLVEMTKTGFHEFNEGLGIQHSVQDGPFGIELHSWDAYANAKEMSEKLYENLEKFNDQSGDLKRIEQGIKDICKTATRRLSFIDEPVKLKPLGKSSKKTALWVRAFLNDDQVDGYGEQSKRYSRTKKEQGILKENPLDHLDQVLNDFREKIQEAYTNAREAPFYTRVRSSSNRQNRTSLVHDDERLSNILAQDNSNTFVIDFEHSHYAEEVKKDDWKLVSVRGERPFKHGDSKQDDGKFTFKHLSYVWEGDIFPDVLRSHASAVANLAIESMQPWYGKEKVEKLMLACIQELTGQCKQWIRKELGKNTADQAISLYTIHLIDRCIDECLHGQETIFQHSDQDFLKWFRDLLENFFKTLNTSE